MDERKQYWNSSYMEYWKSRVEESTRPGNESIVIEGDSKTEGDEVYEMVFDATPMNPGTVLDVGCAWGRMFPVLKKLNMRISGIDISEAMINDAKKQWGSDPAVDALHESPAESMPFANGAFDNVACLAVFDATYQDQALTEFFRVLRTGGLLYLTGKNDNYAQDDFEAIRAEAGARRKSHPNYFTDTAAMLRQVEEKGHEIIATYFFPRRGDFGRENYVADMPETYYEYFVVIRKKNDTADFAPFADSYSRTFKSLSEEQLNDIL